MALPGRPGYGAVLPGPRNGSADRSRWSVWPQLLGWLMVVGFASGANGQAPLRIQDPQEVDVLPKLPAPAARLPMPQAMPSGPAPACEPTISGFPMSLPPLPQRKPRTTDEVVALTDSLSTKAASFEVLVGEGRVLTLKEDIAIPGKPRPLVAVGDPSVLEIVIVGPRQIRVIGQRIGATDLSITTSDGK